MNNQQKTTLLQVQISANPELDDQQLYDQLKLKNIAAKRPITAHDIKQYLMVNSLWLAIKRGVSDECEIARDALAEFDQFDVTDSQVEATLTAILDGLVADPSLSPDFTNIHKAQILAMGDILESWADQNLSGLTVGDIARARP